LGIELFSQTTLALLCGALFLLFLGTAGQLRSAMRSLAKTRAQLDQMEQESYFNSLVVDSANDGLVVQKLDGTVLWVNPGYCRLQGLPAEAMIGRNPMSYCFPPESTPSPEEIAAFRYDPHDPNFATLQMARNIRGNGELFWNQLSVSFRSAPNGETHAILVCRDVTEQVENEEMLRETSAKLEFLSLIHISEPTRPY